MESLSDYFTDELIFQSISTYLNITELLKLSQISKSLRQIIERKCKKIIKCHNLSLISNKSAIHQMRFYFDRCLTIQKKNEDQQQLKQQKIGKLKEKSKQVKQSNENQGHVYQNDKKVMARSQITLQNPFKFKTIVYFQVGVLYSVCLTIDKQAYIFKTSNLINLQQNKKQLSYEKRQNICEIKCKSEHVTYMKENGEIYAIFGNKLSKELIEKEQLINWCQFIQIENIQASFNFTIFKPKKSILYEQFLKYVLFYEIDMEKISETNTNLKYPSNSQQILSNQTQTAYNKQRSCLILLNNITMRYYLIQFGKQQKLVSIIIGSREAYFLNQQAECFVCTFQQDIQNPNPYHEINKTNGNNQYQKKLKSKLYEPFIGKSILKIFSGYNFYLALQRKVYDVQKWTVQDVSKWLRQIQFGSFVKIFNIEKVDGKKLLIIDKNYMHSNLGITKQNMQQKFIMLLRQLSENKNKEDTLYGWGKNQNGQLGSRNANYVKQPQKIKIPSNFKESEYIDTIFCGWYQTFIRTQKGRIYKTVNYERKRKLKDQEKQEGDLKFNKKELNSKQSKKDYTQFQMGYDSDNDKYSTKNSRKHEKNEKVNNTKRKRGYTQDFIKIQSGHKKFVVEQRWTECQIGKAFFVQGYKDVVFYIQCPSQKQFEPTKQKKLRTAKTVINKIIWSLQTSQQQQFKVGYIDKDMGLIEATILQLKAFDLNQNRIKYIKQGNQIVWDRENKTDYIG